MLRILAAELLGLALTYPVGQAWPDLQSDSTSRVHTYYVAADEIDWDYAPGRVSKMMGRFPQ